MHIGLFIIKLGIMIMNKLYADEKYIDHYVN